jgi:hypothetical protein
MKVINSKSKVFTSMGLVLIFGGLVDALAESMKWREEVLLHDGKKIVIERNFTLGGYATLDSRERKALDQILTFNVPGSNEKVIWKTDYRELKADPDSLNLLLLDIVDQKPYIVAYPAGPISHGKWGSPNPPYVFLKYEHASWQRIVLAELPSQLVKTNVIVGRPPAELLRSFYMAEDVEKQNYDIHALEYKNILRMPLDHWKPKLINSGPKAPHPMSPSSAAAENK